MKNALSILAVFISLNVFSQPAGVLDPTFGTNGKVVTSITTGQDKAYGVAIQPDGKIVVVGHSTGTLTGKDFAVIRYKANGVLDSAFGVNGIVTTDLLVGSNDVAYSVALQPDGKIVLAGFCDNGINKDAALVRYKTNGVLDSTFGTNGVVITNFENAQQDEIKVVKIHALTGKIVVGGASDVSSSIGKPVLARYLSSGILDTSFNTTGIKLLWVAVNDVNRIFSVEDLVVESNGKISCVGYRKYVSTSIDIEYWAARVLSNGSMDNTFSTDGVLQYSDGSGSSAASGLLLNSTQDIILCGNRQYNGNYSFRTLKINQNGTISNPSVFYTGYVSGVNKAYKIAEDNNGKYVFVGTSGSTTLNSFTVARINSSNLLTDNSFGTSGFANTTFGNPLNECFNLAIQTDNKIVIVGFTSNDFAIARFLGNATPDLNNFQLSSPVNLATNRNYASLAFDWTDAFMATSYQIDIDDAPSFSSPQTYTTINSSYTASNLQPNKQYYWRVRASDGTNWGSYSTSWSFTTNALENFNLSSPANGSTNQAYASLVLDWTDNLGAAGYQVQLDTTQNFSSNPVTLSTSNSSYTVSLLPLKKYYWRVRASSGASWGQWKTAWNFTTKADPSFYIGEDYFAGLKIFPNPAIDVLTIEANANLLNKPYILFDITGKELLSGFVDDKKTTLKLQGLPSGTYLLQIGDSHKKTIKILKE